MIDLERKLTRGKGGSNEALNKNPKSIGTQKTRVD